jgi:5-formyltetrahydrofolate cyclo-ligase
MSDMEKQAVRERIWDLLEAEGVARFPFPPHGRIPNFAGAEEAAERLAETAVWDRAGTIKANPDAPQRPARRRALEAGKVVYVAVPRLQAHACFLRLDPARLDDLDRATTIAGAADLGEPVTLDAIEPISLILSGSVAVTKEGARIGKGEGFSDLEYAMLREVDALDATVEVTTTVHALQVVEPSWELDPHDVSLDVIATPDGVHQVDDPAAKPRGIDWDRLDPEDLETMPPLQALADRSDEPPS